MLWNVSDEPQRVAVTFSIEGSGIPVPFERLMAPCERYTLGVHTLPEFVGRQRNYSVVVRWPGPGLAQLVMRSRRAFWRAEMTPPFRLQ